MAETASRKSKVESRKRSWRSAFHIALSALVLAVPCVVSAASGDTGSAVEAFKRQHRPVGVQMENGLVTSIHGKAFSHGATAQASVEAFLSQHAALFGVERGALVAVRTDVLMGGKLTAHHFEQRWKGIPVDATRVTARTFARPELSPRGWVLVFRLFLTFCFRLSTFFLISIIHDFVKGIVPEFEGIDLAIPTNVNLADDCNAFYTLGNPSLNFFTSQAGPQPHCANTANSTVIYHEFGHFIIDRALGPVAEGDYHEGVADAGAALPANDACVGPDFFGEDTGCLRRVDEPDFIAPVSQTTR